MKIRVSGKVMKQLESIRNRGSHNMFDYYGVIGEARRLGYNEMADWMLSNRKQYAEGIFNGFETGYPEGYYTFEGNTLHFDGVVVYDLDSAEEYPTHILDVSEYKGGC